MEEIEKLKEEFETLINKAKTMLEKLEKKSKKSSSKSNGYELKIRDTIFKFKPSSYNSSSAIFITEKLKRKQSTATAITVEEWEEIKKLGDQFFYGNSSKSKSNRKNRSYSKKTSSKKSYTKKKDQKSYRKEKQDKEELEVEEASYDEALED